MKMFNTTMRDSRNHSNALICFHSVRSVFTWLFLLLLLVGHAEFKPRPHIKRSPARPNSGNINSMAERNIMRVECGNAFDIDVKIETVREWAIKRIEEGKLATVVTCLRKLIDHRPSEHLQTLLAQVLIENGEKSEGKRVLMKAEQLFSNAFDPKYLLGLLYKKEKRYDAAAVLFAQIDELFESGFLSSDKQVHGLILFHWAFCLKASGSLQKSAEVYRKCVRTDQSNKLCFFNLARTLKELGDISQAENHFKKAIEIDGKFCLALNELGLILQSKHKYQEAVKLYNQCLQSNPNDSNALINLANMYGEMGVLFKSKAIETYRLAVLRFPNDPIIHNNLAYALKSNFEIKEASEHFYKALVLSNGTMNNALTGLIYTKYWECDWESVKEYWSRLYPILMKSLQSSSPDSESDMIITSFQAMLYPLTAETMLQIALAQAQATLKGMSLGVGGNSPYFGYGDYNGKINATKWVQSKPSGNGELRIAYISSDFRGHPITQLMLHVFEYHGSGMNDVKAYLYSTSPDDGSERRKYIKITAYSFTDVSQLSDHEVARTIFDDGIQVLIDLNGWTKGARAGVLALKPAPIVVSYMGFCGSTGAPYTDYIGTDRIASLPHFKLHFSEKFLYLPYQYFVTDYKQSFSEHDSLNGNGSKNNASNRSDFGLPESSFVYCNFNQLYKITPRIFSIWLSILKKVPNSVLWLLSFPAIGQHQLIRWARKFGIESDRLIFSSVLSPELHLKRVNNCNLFLDTPNVNAHTGAADVLWKGVPVLTLPERKMASRVAASLVKALRCTSCEELIADSFTEYEQKAIYLATNLTVYNEIMLALGNETVRGDSPLFNTEYWVHYWEVGLGISWEIYAAGRNTMNIVISRQ